MSEFTPNNPINPEQDQPKVEFASGPELELTYTQLNSLYSQAQNPLFAGALRKARIQASFSDGVAHYKLGTKRRSPDVYHVIDIENTNGTITVHQRESVPLQNGKRIAERDIVIGSEGRAVESGQYVALASRVSGLEYPGAVSPDLNVHYDQQVPVDYITGLQEFMKRIWEAPPSKVFGRILSQ